MNIKPHTIISELDNTKQKYLAENIDNIDFTIDDKRHIFATLKPEVKQEINVDNLPNEYKTAISINTKQVDLDRNLEDYRGLDDLIAINPEKYSKDQREKLLKLCDICPSAVIYNTINNVMDFYSTASEYKDAEQWIDSLINNIKPEYSDAQKLALIDNAIGNKISYSPDYGTEVSNIGDARALWKIISKRLWGVQWDCYSRTVYLKKNWDRK